MATAQVGEVVGRHLPTINIMDDTLLQDFTLPEHKSAMDRIVFLPYTFKELKEVELVEYSAMCAFGITPYITVLQRHLVPRDLFYWGLFSCDASDERLIIIGLNGSATVVGWQELERAFGAKHSEDDEFRAKKIMQKQLLPYNLSDFLPVFIEKNSNKELVSGKEYEENTYYSEAAPYGPTYYLLTVIAELFWCNSKGPRYLTPMVYAYLRALHGNPYNWAKALLHGLKTEILSVQKESRNLDSRRSIQVGWAPVLVHLLYTFRERLFPNSPLASIDHWAQWRLTTAPGDLSFSSLSAKFKEPIADIDNIRELCKFEELEDIDEPEATEGPAQGKKAAARTKSPQVSERMCMHAVNEKSVNGQSPPAKRIKTMITPRKSSAPLSVTTARSAEPGSRPPMRGSVAPSVSAPMAMASSSSDPDRYGTIESVEDFSAAVSAEIQQLLSVKVTRLCSKFALQESLLQEKYDALGKEHSVNVKELQTTNETLTKQVKELKENSTSKLKELKADNERLAVKVTALNCAKEAHGVKIQDLQRHVDMLNNKYTASANLLKEKDAALKAALAA
ncbi:hypothetical protein R1sor_016934 [Riccia sorocarpa]|uniref:Aminotransferase-like plant mobile domain-containing protein n=1 Tax=Riccia sorocarpa TaxID=122646 RepID=A0ABD3HJZ7_9MARC